MSFATKRRTRLMRLKMHIAPCLTGLVAACMMLWASGTVATTSDFSFTLLSSLPASGSSVQGPAWSLLQASDGNFYGVASGGGVNGGGGIYRVTPQGNFSSLVSFTTSTGTSPEGTLFQASNGLFYAGLTNGSENNSSGGKLVSITPTGGVATLHTFANYTGGFPALVNADGVYPEVSVTQAADGTLYGTTYFGGNGGGGTIYSVTTSGTFNVLHMFPSMGSGSSTQVGSAPMGKLLLGNDGNFYGVTRAGGANGNGVIYSITPGGTYTVLQSFPTSSVPGYCGAGFPPDASALVLGTDGKIYGTECGGGANGNGYFYRFDPSTSTITDLYDFAADTSSNVGGAYPNGALAVGPDGNFYGTAGEGGTNGTGTAFVVTPSGAFTTIYNFSAGGGTDGKYPLPLIVGSDNNFYGTAETGGANNTGAVYKLGHLPQNDIVMFNVSNAGLDTRLINALGTQQVLQNVAEGYYPVAVGDFDGDGVPDILWTSPKNDLYIWFGGKGSSTGFKGKYVGTYPAGWSVVGAGDLDGDGKSDILWIDASTHQFGYWLMDGATETGHVITSYTPGYYPVALGDFNGDGKTDVVWSSANNDLYIWFSNVSPSSNGFTSSYAGTYPSGWKLAGTGDLDGDGKSDFVWMKTDGTEWGYWLMNGVQRKTINTNALTEGEVGYSIVNVSDYNQDGLADLVWSNGSSLYLWTNTNTSGNATVTFSAEGLAAPAAGMTVFNNNVH